MFAVLLLLPTNWEQSLWWVANFQVLLAVSNMTHSLQIAHCQWTYVIFLNLFCSELALYKLGLVKCHKICNRTHSLYFTTNCSHSSAKNVSQWEKTWLFNNKKYIPKVKFLLIVPPLAFSFDVGFSTITLTCVTIDTAGVDHVFCFLIIMCCFLWLKPAPLTLWWGQFSL